MAIKASNIIFCLSYLEVPVTITLVESSEDSFVIVTSEPVLKKFLERMYSPEMIVLIPERVKVSLNPYKFMANLYRISQSKAYLRKIAETFEFKEGFFFGTGFCEFECWFLRKLSIQNIYYNPLVSLDHLPEDASLKGKVLRCYFEFLFGEKFRGVTNGLQHFRVVSDSFLQDIGVVSFTPQVNKEVVANRVQEVLGTGKCKVLILCGWVANYYVSEGHYVQMMDRIIYLLSQLFGEVQLKVKAHPQCQEYYSKEVTLNKIPEDIPASLFLDNVDIVVGYESAVLIEAANAKKIAISTLRLMPPINSATRDKSIEYLKNNATENILFPKSIVELERHISSYISG